MVGEGTGVFSKKAGRKKRIEGEFRKKVHKFLFDLFSFSKIETFFPQNLRSFETKSLLLRLIKHNFPFIPPHCGIHIAQSRGTFPDHPAQTLFDLLNHRDFIISRPIRTGQKALFLNTGWHLHDSDATLLVCTKTRGSKEYISQHLFEELFVDDIHLVTRIHKNMKNSLIHLRDKILQRKRSLSRR